MGELGNATSRAQRSVSRRSFVRKMPCDRTTAVGGVNRRPSYLYSTKGLILCWMMQMPASKKWGTPWDGFAEEWFRRHSLDFEGMPQAWTNNRWAGSLCPVTTQYATLRIHCDGSIFKRYESTVMVQTSRGSCVQNERMSLPNYLRHCQENAGLNFRKQSLAFENGPKMVREAYG